MEKNRGSELDSYYYNKNSSRKHSGIYCHQIDRWVLIDEYDLWTTMKTAQTLSSKIATTVYVISDGLEINNQNCMNYGIIDKTIHTRKNVADLIQNQTPTLKKISGKNIMMLGVPEDYNNFEGKFHLRKLKRYADYVNKHVQGIEIINAKNWVDNKTVSNMFYPSSWNEEISSYEDKSDSGKSLFSELYSVLYFSNTVEEADDKIYAAILDKLERKTISLLKVNMFYDIVGVSNPFANYSKDLS